MSLRRQSCAGCFKAKRRCDLTLPTCRRCQKAKKDCRYAYTPVAGISGDPETGNSSDAASPVNPASALMLRGNFRGPTSTARQKRLLKATVPDVPRFYGDLGEVPPPLTVQRTCGWVANQLKEIPGLFAVNSETMFIHPELYGDALPKALRTAYGLCGASIFINERNQAMLFRTIDAEIADMAGEECVAVQEDLARLQSLVLYQLIRLSNGDIRQQLIAEQQESLVTTYGYQLLAHAEAEIEQVTTWESWILAESIRRTVVVAFLLYAKWFCDSNGACHRKDDVMRLPVSAEAGLWKSKSDTVSSSSNETLPYQVYTSAWVASPRAVDPYQRLLLIACQGKERVESLTQII